MYYIRIICTIHGSVYFFYRSMICGFKMLQYLDCARFMTQTNFKMYNSDNFIHVLKMNINFTVEYMNRNRVLCDVPNLFVWLACALLYNIIMLPEPSYYLYSWSTNNSAPLLIRKYTEGKGGVR